jgi:hypothetical protein
MDNSAERRDVNENKMETPHDFGEIMLTITE